MGVGWKNCLIKSFMMWTPLNKYYDEQFKLDEVSGTRETHRHRYEDNIKVDFTEIELRGYGLDSSDYGFCEHGNGHSGNKERGEFDNLKDYSLLNVGCVHGVRQLQTISQLNKERPALCHLLYYFIITAQHVSDVNTSIFRSLRLICWVISWVVLIWFNVCWCYGVVRLGWCGIRMQASACIRIPHHTTPAKPQRNTNTHRTRTIQPMK